MVVTASESAAAFPISPQVAFEGDSYLVVWNSGPSVRAARITSSGTVSPSFIVANGNVWSAAPARDGTMIAYGVACGSIATRVIARGQTNGTVESIVSLRADAQLAPRLATTAYGHQSIWFESNTLFTRFIANNGILGRSERLSSATSYHASIVAFQDGSAVVWFEGNSLLFARFDGNGNLVSNLQRILSTPFVFTISLAAAGDEVLVVTSGEQDLFKNEVDGALLGPYGDILQRVVLSNPGEDGFNAIAGGDASRWFAAWRNGASQLVAIEMPHADLRQPMRFTTTLPTTISGSIGGILPGDDPAVIWSNGNVHATYIHSQLDILVAQANAIDLRVIGRDAFWTETAATTRILSAPITKTPAPAPIERACLAKTAIGIDYDVRNDAVDAVAYPEGPQLRVQLRGFARRRAVR